MVRSGGEAGESWIPGVGLPHWLNWVGFSQGGTCNGSAYKHCSQYYKEPCPQWGSKVDISIFTYLQTQGLFLPTPSMPG